jgi:D-hydroxyproline dehydrogenase subunit beta
MDADVIVVGAGILGLAHALAASRAGARVLVLDRDAQANGASVRNFGFVTVTGQRWPDTWRRARRARAIWAELAAAAAIPVVQRGLYLACRRPEALAVAEAFVAGPMGEGCRLLTARDLPEGFAPGLTGALHSPHELRVESREAIPRLAAWLAERQGVGFERGVAVRAVAPGEVMTTRGPLRAERILVCPGPDLVSLFPEAFARRATTLCKLHMLRVAAPGFRLPGAVMSDLGLARYAGYADTPPLPALRARLAAEQGEELANGIHLIAVQGGDGSLVVGDSHHYGATPDPFQPAEVDALILRELSAVLAMPAPSVLERWIGLYPSGPEDMFAEEVAPGVKLVSVTSGTGASTAFAIAEETLEGWL